jgi:hypothetical protein
MRFPTSTLISPSYPRFPDSPFPVLKIARWITWMEDFEMFWQRVESKTKRRNVLVAVPSRFSSAWYFSPANRYAGNANDYKTAKDKLREYFEPQKNRRYEVFKFRQAKQESNETLDQFHTRLRVLAQTCSQWRRLWNRTADNYQWHLIAHS